MQVIVKCNGKRVTKGIKETVGAIKFKTAPILDFIASNGAMEAVQFLEESYVRPEWTQSGQLKRAIFNSVGNFNRATWSSGIGNVRILTSQAHYWEEIEEGTKLLQGTYRGYFIDEVGGVHKPTKDRNRHDKWINVGSGGHIMDVNKPITAHKYFDKTSEYVDARFFSKMIAAMNEVFAIG